jgi:lipoprotein-anchoring transpeptidase ErfK/SrfK
MFFTRRSMPLLAIVLMTLAWWVPSATAQTAQPLFFPATGHTLDDDAGFLSFWLANRGEQLLGLPISQPISNDTGIFQYFEYARLEQRRDAAGNASVVTAPVAKEYAAAIYRSFPDLKNPPDQQDVRWFATTRHTLRGAFRSFWEANNGVILFGAPISEPLWERVGSAQRQVQYFEHVRLERDASLAGTSDEIQLSDLGRTLASMQGIDLTPVENPGYALAGPAAAAAVDIAPFTPRPTAAPTAVPAPAPPNAPAKPAVSSKGKRIVVNLSDQWVYAYENGELVFDAPVSTGRDGMETPTGIYSIYAKLKLQTMDGVDNGVPWVVPNVPNVMYFNGGVALHGTYWHNRFGSGARLSHGCVNLPLKAAGWLYDWAPMGTTVVVTY